MPDALPLSGISGLSFCSFCLSPLLFFCLDPLHFCLVIFLMFVQFPDILSRKFSSVFFKKQAFCVALIEQLGDGSGYVRFAARLYGTGMCHYAFILRFKERNLSFLLCPFLLLLLLFFFFFFFFPFFFFFSFFFNLVSIN